MTTAGTRRDATENRAALLAAARIALNEDPAASLETIAAAAGLSRRAVYGHFASRDDLLRELLTNGAERVSAAIDTSRHDDPVTDLALVAANLWREVESMRVMALFAVRGPFKGLTASALAPLRERVLADVTRGQAARDIRNDIDAPTLAHLVEEGALMVLDEATTKRLSSAQGHALVMNVVLSLIGLGWRDAHALIDSHRTLLTEGAAS
jgi:AcrR family transcriptional regulator